MPSVSNVVTFKAGDGTTYNSVDDWGLTLEDWDAQKPGGKWEYIDVPGAAGALDVSRALSQDVPPKTRVLELTFTAATDTHAQAVAAVDAVTAAVHLQKMNIQTPDDTSAGLWYVGNCEISNFEYIGTGARIEVTAECDPYRYSDTGGEYTAAELTPVSIPVSSIAEPMETARILSRTLSIQYDPDANNVASAAGYAICYASSSNLFDFDLSTIHARKATHGGTWGGSSDVKQDGQAVAFGAIESNNVQRASIIDTNATSGLDHPAFPFAGDTVARFFIYSGEVTAVRSSNVVLSSGETFAPGLRIGIVSDAFGSIGANGIPTNGTSRNSGIINPPAVGSFWNGEYVDVALNGNESLFSVDVAGVAASDVFVRVMFYKAGSAPANWVAPAVEVERVQLASPFRRQRKRNNDGSVISGQYVTDTATRGAASASCSHLVWEWVTPDVLGRYVAENEQTAVTIDHPDALYIAAVAIDQSGAPVWGGAGLVVYGYAYPMDETTINITGLPAYPTVTTGGHDAVIEYGGNVYTVRKNSTAQLPGVLSRGANVVSITGSTYNEFEPGAYEVALSWPLGVL